jgi:hypothetical protein
MATGLLVSSACSPVVAQNSPAPEKAPTFYKENLPVYQGHTPAQQQEKQSRYVLEISNLDLQKPVAPAQPASPAATGTADRRVAPSSSATRPQTTRSQSAGHSVDPKAAPHNSTEEISKQIADLEWAIKTMKENPDPTRPEEIDKLKHALHLKRLELNSVKELND